MTKQKKSNLATGKPAELRKVNRRRVLQALRDHGPLSRTELAARLDLSKVTASSIINESLAERLVREVGQTHSGVGRRAAVFDLSPELGKVLAVDIDASTTQVALCDLRGNTVAVQAFPTAESLEDLQKALAGVSQALCASSSSALMGSIYAVGVSVPASIDNEGMLRHAGFPDYLDGVRLGESIGRRFPDVPIRVMNNMNAAVLAEHHFGCAGGWSNYAFLGIRDSGVGIGLFLNGELYRGAHGYAGEVGLVQLSETGGVLDSIARGARSDLAYSEVAQTIAFAYYLLDLDGLVFHSTLDDPGIWMEKVSSLLARHVPGPLNLRQSALGSLSTLRGTAFVAAQEAWERVIDLDAPV